MITTDPNDPALRELLPGGQQAAYLVLSEEERGRGFVRPYRDTYEHVGVRPTHPTRELTDEERERYKAVGYVAFEEYPEGGAVTGRFWTAAALASGCGTRTSMGKAIAETYARDPAFYGATFCARCGKHAPVAEFRWVEKGRVTDLVLGS